MVGIRSLIDRMLPGHDALINAEGKKSVPARSATIGGKSQQAEQPGHYAISVLAGNALQIHVPAHSAMHITDIPDGSRPRIKPQIAAPTAPWPQKCYPDQVVLQAAPSRSARTVAMTDGTYQSSLPLVNSKERIRDASPARQVTSMSFRHAV
jgi:hypothetical protein